MITRTLWVLESSMIAWADLVNHSWYLVPFAGLRPVACGLGPVSCIYCIQYHIPRMYKIKGYHIDYNGKWLLLVNKLHDIF